MTWLRAIWSKHWPLRFGKDANTSASTNPWLGADALSMERTAWATLAHEASIADGHISMTTGPPPVRPNMEVYARMMSLHLYTSTSTNT
jgi:hypothetical protein